ncbi:hypothetical protein [Rhodococcus koreensis]
MANSLLMREALNEIIRDPMGWDQSAWRKCFAAKVCEAAGAEWVRYGNSTNSRSDWFVIPRGETRVLSCRQYALELLELTLDEFEAVTDGDRTLEELQHIVGLYELREQARAVHMTGHSSGAMTLHQVLA